MSEWNEEALFFAIDNLIQELDYDLWKDIKHGEEDGIDHRPEFVETFKGYYQAYLEASDE